MRLTTQSEYALICLRTMCQAEMKPVSISDLSEREQMSKDYVEQLFLKLKRAGIVKSIKGAHGGYLLAKEPCQISVKDVVEALEGSTYEAFCDDDVRERIVCTYFSRCSVRPMWLRLKELIDDFLSNITLDMLLRDEECMAKHVASLSGNGAAR